MQVTSTLNNSSLVWRFTPLTGMQVQASLTDQKIRFYTPLDEEKHCGRKMSFERTQGIEPRPLIWRELR